MTLRQVKQAPAIARPVTYVASYYQELVFGEAIVMLEIVAMGSMLLDHVGLLFWPHLTVLRIVGRLALPLYAYAMVQAYRHSHDRRVYALRLLAIAILTQPVFTAVFGAGHWNMVWSLLASFGLLCAVEAAPGAERLAQAISVAPATAVVVVRMAMLTAGTVAFAVLPLDYGLYGWGLVLLFAHVTNPIALVVGHVALNAVSGALGYWWQVQMWSTVATVLLVLRAYPPLRQGRWVYQVFYPGHLMVLAALLWLRAAM